MQGQIQQRRLIGRPPGLFAITEAALLAHLGTGRSYHTNEELAAVVCKSPTQVGRYLRRLKAAGKISIENQRWRFKGNWCVRRKITVVQEA